MICSNLQKKGRIIKPVDFVQRKGSASVGTQKALGVFHLAAHRRQLAIEILNTL